LLWWAAAVESLEDAQIVGRVLHGYGIPTVVICTAWSALVQFSFTVIARSRVIYQGDTKSTGC